MKRQLLGLGVISTLGFALPAMAAPHHGGGGGAAHSAPAYHAPAYHAPAYHAPAYHAPVHQAPAFHSASAVRPQVFHPNAVSRPSTAIHPQAFSTGAARSTAAIHPQSFSNGAARSAPTIHPQVTHPMASRFGQAPTSARIQQHHAATFSQAPYSTRGHQSPAAALQARSRAPSTVQQTIVRQSFANAPVSSRRNYGGRSYPSYGGYYGNGGRGYGGYGNGYGYGGYGNGYGGYGYGSRYGYGAGYPFNFLLGSLLGYGYGSFGGGGYGYPYNWLGSAYGGGYPQSFFGGAMPYDMTDPGYGPPQDPVPPAAQVYDSQPAPTVDTGLKIVEATDGAAAQIADLRPNDIILGVGDQRVRSFAELQSALARATGETAIVFINAESGKTEKLFVTPVDGKIGVAVVPVELK